MIRVLVLAAGASKRFGSDKLRADVCGRPLLDWTLELVLRTVSAQTCHIVVRSLDGFGGDTRGATLIEAPDAALGMSHSIFSGLAGLPEDTSGAILVLGDDPLAALALSRVHAAAMLAPEAVIAVRRPGGAPHPVHLPRWAWPEGPKGDDGLRRLLDGDTVWVDTKGLPDPVDVDTPADLDRLIPLMEALAPV